MPKLKPLYRQQLVAYHRVLASTSGKLARQLYYLYFAVILLELCLQFFCAVVPVLFHQ